jgi:two-component system, cell cycle response regulator DivK
MAVMELDCLEQGIPSKGFASATVLVADSNPDELELMAFILEGCGYKMLPARDGETALRLVERCRPVLVFTELMLPILDGIAIAQRLRQQANLVPLIAVTTLPINLVRPSILQIGFNDYICKPFLPDQIEMMVTHYLEQAAFSR